MTNELLIKKILKKINYKPHKLTKPMLIDNELLKEIIFYNNELPSGYAPYIANNDWEIPLSDLKNRELIKLYQSL